MFKTIKTKQLFELHFFVHIISWHNFHELSVGSLTFLIVGVKNFLESISYFVNIFKCCGCSSVLVILMIFKRVDSLLQRKYHL